MPLEKDTSASWHWVLSLDKGWASDTDSWAVADTGESVRPTGVDVQLPLAWQFGAFTLLPTQRLLLEAGTPVRVGGRALDILIVLVKAAGEVVGQDELMTRVWQKVVVDEVSLRVHVAALRRVLGDDGGARRYIVNVPGRGYSFVGEARSLPLSGGSTPMSGTDPRPRLLPPLHVQVIGRDDKIREVVASVTEHRLVSIVGTGGIGKTTIALAAANQLAANYRDGARFVDLAPLTDPRHVAVQVAHAVADIAFDAGALDLESLLSDRQMLIVLDNCEHVVHAVASIAETMLQAAPGVRLLATSREPIRASGEFVLRLSPLDLPLSSARMSAQEALGFSAIQLFYQRTAASTAGFALADADVPMVVEICRHLDGIPLAIELAAGRVAQLGLRGLSARLTDRLSVLGKGRRTVVSRQQTLRATLDWSYDLLSGHEQAMLRRLSVFAGAFSFDSAVAVCEDELPADSCDVFDDLVLKSLISVDAGTDVASYRLLEVTRAYALEKLKAAGELEAASRAHALHVCTVFERLDTGSPLDHAVDHAWQLRWMDDIQFAVQASFATLRDTALGMRLLAATSSVWYDRFLLDDYRKIAEKALHEAGSKIEQPAMTMMRLWHSLGHCYWHIKGPHPDVARAFGHTYAIARSLQNVDYERRALWGMWAERAGSGDYAASLDLAHKHAALATPGATTELDFQGWRITQLSLHLMGEQEASRDVGLSMVELVQSSHDQRPLGRFQLEPRSEANAVLSRSLWIQGLPEQALRAAEEAVQSARSAQHDLTLCFALFGQCAVLMWCGRWEELRAQADELWSVASNRRLIFWRTWGQTFRDAQTYGVTGVVEPRWQSPVVGPHQLELMATVGHEFLEGQALLRAEAGQCPWCAPEVLRARGEMLLRQGGSPQEGEPWLVRSLDLARSSKALSWELRAATSLARCWLSQSRRAEATALLSDVLDRFTEGFDSADVQRARAVLQA